VRIGVGCGIGPVGPGDGLGCWRHVVCIQCMLRVTSLGVPTTQHHVEDTSEDCPSQACACPCVRIGVGCGIGPVGLGDG